MKEEAEKDFVRDFWRIREKEKEIEFKADRLVGIREINRYKYIFAVNGME